MAQTHSVEGPVKLFGLLKRRPDLSLEAFSRHWRTTHAREAMKLSGFFERYVQNHAAAESVAGFARPCDGVPELWFKRIADALAMGQSPEYMTGAYIDEPNFMDGRSLGLVVREMQISPGPPLPLPAGAVKLLVFWRRRRDSDETLFREAFVAQTRPFVLPQGRYVRFIRGLALPHPAMGSEPLFDATEELWWLSRAEFEGDRPALAQGESLRAWLDPSQSAALVVEENYVHWPALAS